jgi:hypothetical protein
LKTLIYQIKIGKGTQWLSNQIIDGINKFCIPSVKAYAKKNNYDYRIFTEDIFSNFGKNFLNSKGTSLAFNKYLYLKYLDYDQIVYIDTDVYIFEESEKLPLVKTFAGVAEPNTSEAHKLYREYYLLNEDFQYINSGFFICDRNSATKLANYMIERVRLQKKGKPKNTDNGLLNEYLYLNDKSFKFNLLDNKWNYWPHYKYKDTDKIKPNFIHFVGGDGSEYLNNLIKKNNNLKNYLEKIYHN